MTLLMDTLSLTTDILHHSQQSQSNRVCERKIKGFSFTDSQQTRFLAVVQDVRQGSSGKPKLL